MKDCHWLGRELFGIGIGFVWQKMFCAGKLIGWKQLATVSMYSR
jgi:hypothetical protein